MITTPTVLVLGAGASVPYGLPTAIDLRSQILRRSIDGNLKSRMQAEMNPLGLTSEFINGFFDDFKNSTIKSVDAFLERRPEYAAVGKVVIFHAIASQESEGSLQQLDWLAELFTLMDDGCNLARFKENKLSVVTFNYDRVFEQSLVLHLRHGYGASPEQIEEVFRCIQIIHAYGYLGSVFPNHKDHLAFAPRPGSYDAIRLGPRLQMIGDELRDSDQFSKAQLCISQADRVIFIGFGFHALNLQRITARGRKKHSRWLACGCGMTPAEMRVAQRRVPSGSHPDEDRYYEILDGRAGGVIDKSWMDNPHLPAYQSISFGHTKHKASDFLREHADFLLEDISSPG